MRIREQHTSGDANNCKGGIERVGGVGVGSRCISIQALNDMPFSEVNVENRRRSGPRSGLYMFIYASKTYDKTGNIIKNKPKKNPRYYFKV